MRIVIIIILVILALLINYKKEYFDLDRTIEPNNFIEDDEDLSIKIDKKLIKKMYEIATFIDDDNKYEPSIYSDLPVNYKNRNTYIQILYEMYVIDFLDNRFAIVEPDIPDPRIQKSIILRIRIRIFR